MKFLRYFTLSFLLSLTVISNVFAEYRSSKTMLDNGLTVLVTEMPSSPKVAVYCLIKAGSATEGEYLGGGLSHYLEHMLFKETETRKVGEIASFVQSVGGTINASTSFDYTIYTLDVPDTQFDNALDIVADMVQHAKFSPEEFAKEGEVIYGEMRLNEDNPDRFLGQLVFSNVYTKHTYQHPIIGYKNSFAQLTPKDLEKYYKTYYVPTNMILSIAGHVTAEEILPKIKEAFNAPRKFAPLRNIPEEPPQITKREVRQEFSTDLTRLSMAFAGIRLMDEDLFALDVLANLLGSGRSSRLYKSILKDKRLVYSISASDYTPLDKGYFEIEALLDEPKLPQAKEAIWNEINKIKKEGISSQELEKAKKSVISDHIFGLDSSSGVAYAAALDEAFSGDYQFSRKYVEGIQNLKINDIKRVANVYLKESALTVCVLSPAAEKLTDVQKEKSTAAAIEKHVLSNGLTVLLREDHSLPIVFFSASLNGGLLQEPEGLEGISQFTSSVLVKATKSKSSNNLSEAVEANGLGLRPFSGKNSFGFSLQSLTGDFELAFGLFQEILKAPAFNEEDIQLVKEMTRAVLKTRKDNIFTFTNLHLNKLLFENYPYAHDVLGTEESLAKISQKELTAFYNSLKSPKNLVISIFGDIDKAKTLKLLQDAFGSWQAGELTLQKSVVTPLAKTKESNLTLDRQQAMIMIGFQGPGIKEESRYPVEVLTEILGSSFSGRLFKHVREELGEAYTVGGQYIPGIDTGSIVFYALTTKDSVERVKAVMLTEIEKIRKNFVQDAELAAEKIYLRDSFRSELETNDSLSQVASLDELYGLGFNAYLSYGEKLEGISKEAIQQAAQQYLDLSKAVVVVTLPSK